ncbi:MAG: hypothetical protein VKJ04_00080 [Vampirovibrionales bacterium]|nr:hypothetical protein [Vampirovibrionales bacterium]
MTTLSPIHTATTLFGQTHAQRSRQAGQPYLIRQTDLGNAKSALAGLTPAQGGSTFFTDNAVSVVWLQGLQPNRINRRNIPLVSLNNKDAFSRQLHL